MIAACGSVSYPTNFYNEDDFDIGKTICIAGKLCFVCKSRWPWNSFGKPDEFLSDPDYKIHSKYRKELLGKFYDHRLFTCRRKQIHGN